MTARRAQDAAPAPRPTAPDWTLMPRADFDATAPLELFGLAECTAGPRPPDVCGTPDMFAAS